jgi:hypothetical protein
MTREKSLLSWSILLTAAVFCRAAETDDALLASAQRTVVVTGQGFFPVALRLADGRIAVVLRGGAPHVGIEGRLDMVFSQDEGKTWTKPSVVNDSPVDDRNPALGQASNGDLVVAFWRTATYDDKGRYNESLDKPIQLLVTRSADGGKSWSEPEEVDVSDIGAGNPYGKMLTMPDGSMLMAVYGEPIRPAGSPVPVRKAWANSYLYRSTDQGRTWKRYANMGLNGFNETGLARLPDGTLLAALRSSEGEMWLSRSGDGGKSWSKPAQLASGSVHPADICVLDDGRPLLVTGYRVQPFGVRGVVGDLEGNFDWQHQFVLVNDAVNTDCGYPSSVVLKDGRVLTVYYAVAVEQHPEWGVHCGAVVFEPPAKP